MNIFEKMKIRRMLRKKNTFQVIIDSSICDMDAIKYYFKILLKYGFVFIKDRKKENGNQFIYCNPKRAKKMEAYTYMDVYYDNSLYTKCKSTALCSKCPHYGICYNKGG